MTAAPLVGTPYDEAIAGLPRRRAEQPDSVAAAWAGRRRRPLLREDGRLLIVAADHPARGALAVAGDADAMASRTDLLRRLAVALARPGVDGVLGTADILEDLLLLGLLEDKVAFGSMNRGGLAGASYELDDRFTGYTAQAIAAHRLEGGKMLTRICLTDSASAATMEASARAVTDLADRGLVAMVEPFWSERAGTGAIRNLLDPDSVIRSMHVAAGLGATSAYTWLKLPVVPEMGRVLDATTLPVLLLGGDPGSRADETYSAWAQALQSPTTIGLVVGRALLYPGDGDVAGAVDAAARLVHGSGPSSSGSGSGARS